MPRITVDFSNVSDEGGAVHISEGLYKLRLTQAKLGRGKESKQPKVTTVWTVVGPRKAGVKLFRDFSLQPQALFSLRNMLLALGYNVPKKPVTLDTDQWLKRECGAEIVDNEFVQNGRKRVNSQIDSFISLKDYEAARTPAGAESLDEAVTAVEDLLDDEEVEDEDDEVEDGDDDEDEIDLADL
jgi:hypothetical protein